MLQSAFNFKAAGKACDWRDDQYVTLQPSAESKSDQPANEIDTHLHTNTNTNRIHMTKIQLQIKTQIQRDDQHMMVAQAQISSTCVRGLAQLQ